MKPTLRFLVSDPAHFIALGFGSGLMPKGPGTAGTRVGWLLFLFVRAPLSEPLFGGLLLASFLFGILACERTGRALGVADHGGIVWGRDRRHLAVGTAGFTAALALLRMQDNRQTPALGPVAVTGASGGVGMLAIDIFSRAGYEVHAISGKADHFDFLHGLGASECIDRHQLAFSGKPMDSARFGGALDNVGGSMLGGLLPLVSPYGNVAICGNAGGVAFDSTVMPFIIRGVSVLGIASAGTALPIRRLLWEHLASDWKPAHLERIVCGEAGLDDLPGVFARMLAGGSLGRTLVRV